MSTERIVIFSGGSLVPKVLEDIKANDLIIGADRGALFLIHNGLQPHLSLGDFDSVTDMEKEKIKQSSRHYLECDAMMKDLTDTEMAFEWAIQQNPREIIMYGALGTRFDHSLANVHLLWTGLQKGIACKIIDAYNEITLVDRKSKITKGRFSHVSLLPLSMEVRGITLEGFQYPLIKANLTIGQSLGVSNVLVQEEGHIYVEQGQLLVIQSMD